MDIVGRILGPPQVGIDGMLIAGRVVDPPYGLGYAAECTKRSSTWEPTKAAGRHCLPISWRIDVVNAAPTNQYVPNFG